MLDPYTPTEALVELLPERIGSLLSLNALREDLQVAFGTVQNWMNALAQLYYLFELRPYSVKLVRALRREGKVYLFDCSEIENSGNRFENLVALHLLKACDAWNDLGLGDYCLHYVRDKEIREVDFLVARNRRPYFLIEAKLAEESIHPPLIYFHERLKPKYSIKLVRQAKPDMLRKHAGGVLGMSAARFLSLLP